MVQSRCRADMRAAVEPRAEHKDTAFAGRAAGGDHCRQATVRLRQAQFRDFLEQKFLSSARRKPARYPPNGGDRSGVQDVAPTDRLQGRSAITAALSGNRADAMECFARGS